MRSHIALLVTLLLAPLSQATEWRKNLEDYLHKPALGVIQVEAAQSDGEIPVVRVTNKTNEKIKYCGYSKDSPQLFYEEFKEGKWVDTIWMWCGTGMETYTLPPGQKTELQIKRWPSLGDFRAYTFFDSLDDKRCSLVLLYEEKKASPYVVFQAVRPKPKTP